jgi:hypothetical protein
MNIKQLKGILEDKNNLIIIKKVEIRQIPNLFPSKSTVGFDEFRQRVCGRLMLNKQEGNQVIKELEKKGAAEVNNRKASIFFK